MADLRFGVIGWGYWGPKIARNLDTLPHAMVSMIADMDVTLTFAGGMTAHIHVSWLRPCKIRRVTIIGDGRMAVYDDINPSEMLKIYNKGAAIHADPVVSYRFGAITIPHIDWIEVREMQQKCLYTSRSFGK